MTLEEYELLPHRTKVRIEIADIYIKLLDCKWYEFSKKKNLKKTRDLIFSVYGIIEPLRFL